MSQRKFPQKEWPGVLRSIQVPPGYCAAATTVATAPPARSASSTTASARAPLRSCAEDSHITQYPSTLPAAAGVPPRGRLFPPGGVVVPPVTLLEGGGLPGGAPMRAHLRRLVCVLAMVVASTGCDGKLTGKPGDGDTPGGGTPEPPEIPVTPWETVAP